MITIAVPSTSVILQDLYDTLRTIESEADAMDNESIIDASGKQWLSADTLVGLTITLINAIIGFEARPGPSWAQCIISGGNLTALDINGDFIWPINPTAFVHVNFSQSTSPTMVVSGSGVTDQDKTDIALRTLDFTDGIESGLTPRGALRLIAAGEAGKVIKSDGPPITAQFKNVGGNKTRITAEMDGQGNRTSVTVDPS